jgi:uncharacterized protein YkwD
MKKSFFITLLIIFVLTACGRGGNTQSAPAANTTVAAAPATATAPAANPQVIPTNTAPAVIPTNPPGCTDSATFVADVTVPDNTPFSAGEAFTKTWRIQNNGACAWNENYSIVFSNGEQMGAPASTPLAYTPPGETLDISVELIAPERNGAFVGNFELRNDKGEAVPVDYGKYMWVTIVVGDVVIVEAPGGAGGGTPGGTVPPVSGGPCAYTPNPDFINQTLALVNSQRVAHGLPALTLNAQLTAAAQGHAADMACNSFLSHVGSNGSSVQVRVSAAGYPFSVALENIYAQPPQYGGTPESAVQWWMSDLIHRNTMLHEKVTEIGVGYAFFADSQLDGYWSVVFAAP